MKALIYTAYPSPYQERLEKAFRENGFSVRTIQPAGPENRKLAEQEIQDADAAICGGPLSKEAIESSSLRWIHFDWVGIEGAISRKMFEKGIIVTNGSGRNSICLSEHVFYFIFTLVYETRNIFRAQDSHIWKVEHDYPYTSLFGKTMMILGTGSIGQEIAARAKAFGMRTIGYGRTRKSLPCFDAVHASSEGTELKDIVQEADFLISAASLNAESYHMISNEVFSRMKNTAYVINISRGSIIDEEAMIEALLHKKIAGAGLDTVEKEPLSEESPLWDIRNVVITPHSTPQSPLKFEIGIGTVIGNIPRFLEGSRLMNQQDMLDIL